MNDGDGQKSGFIKFLTTKRYTAGNLEYSPGRLLVAMILVLVGVFTYSIAVSFVPRIIPIKLKALGASNTLMILIVSTFTQILNMTVCPWVSFKSDRYRHKRWGRRFPFIFYTMPMMCAAWLMFAFVDLESAALVKLLSPWVKIAPTTMTIILLATIMVFYNFFYMFVGSVIYYVYNDVIPPQFMTRFMGAVQIVSALQAALFNFFIFKNAIVHFTPVLVGLTIFYAIGISLMCLLVKEPQLPPPNAEEKRQSKGIRGIASFAKESFSHRFYWYNFCFAASATIAGSTSIFMVFFEQNMGMDYDMIGKFSGIGGLAATIQTFAIAVIGTHFIDRWHPVRVNLMGGLFAFIWSLLDCRWLFFSPPVTVFFWGVLLANQANFIIRFRAIASMPSLMRLFPKSRFGQFCSAQSMFRSLMVLVFSLLLGMFMDFLKSGLNLGEYAYRFIYVWTLFFTVLSGIFGLLQYREFLKLGGFNGYKAPAPWLPEKLEAMPVTETVPASRLWVKIAMSGIAAACAAVLLWSLFMTFYSRYLGSGVMSRWYLCCCVPLNGAVLVFALFTFMRALSRKHALPHHSILMLVMICFVLLAASFGVENFLAARLSAGKLAPQMWLYESAVLGVIILLINFYIFIERKSHAAAGKA